MMKARGLAVLAASALLAACGEPKGPVVPPAPPASAPAPAPASPVVEDRHWIRSDEVFVPQDEGQADQPCFEVSIARLLEGPSAATNGEARVFGLRADREFRAKRFWRTRPAEAGDLKAGTAVIFFKGPMTEARAHGAPASKEEARPGGDCWFRGTIEDDSGAARGLVRVAGYDYPLRAEAVRAVVP